MAKLTRKLWVGIGAATLAGASVARLSLKYCQRRRNKNPSAHDQVEKRFHPRRIIQVQAAPEPIPL